MRPKELPVWFRKAKAVAAVVVYTLAVATFIITIISARTIENESEEADFL